MTYEAIKKEAEKCLQCKNAKCKEACPVKTPINEVIDLFLKDKLLEAGEKLFLNNPLSLICSQVCYHESACEGNCVLNKKDNSVKWHFIEKHISEKYLNEVKMKVPLRSEQKKVAIVGSGPAGLTIAFQMALKGYGVTLFEAHDKIGGVLRYGIPSFRLPKEILEKIKSVLEELGVRIRPNTLIGPIINIDDLFRDGYNSIFIGTGVWNPKALRIKGESLGNVHYAIDYLKNPDVYKLGDKLCVIGAGNVALDVARTALRNGVKEVYLMYRKGEKEMPASKLELEHAKLEGVKFEFYKNPLEITENGIKYENTSENFEFTNEKEGFFVSKSIIIAISQGPKENIISYSKGIEVNKFGLLITDEEGRTTREGVFASGDVVTGAKTVVEAIMFAKKTVNAMENYMLNN